MLKISSTPAEMYEKVGIPASAAAELITRSTVRKEIKADGTDSKVEGKMQK
jgi:hypothetical protein